MDQFDIRKFLTENKLTVSSRQTNKVSDLEEGFWDTSEKLAKKADDFSDKVKSKVKKAFSQKNVPEDDIKKAGKFDWKYGVERDKEGKVLDSKVWKRDKDGKMQKVKK